MITTPGEFVIRIGGATIIAASGATTAPCFPCYSISISLVPNTISAIGSASLRLITVVLYPTVSAVVSYRKTCLLYEVEEE